MDYEKIHEVSAAIIIDSENRFLIQKKDSEYPLGPNKWSLIGGHVEENEDAKDAVIREVKEEIGIDFEGHKIKFSKEFLFEGELNGKYVKVNHNVFEMRFEKDISDIRVGEGAGFAFFEKDELKKLDLMSPTKKILEEFL